MLSRARDVHADADAVLLEPPGEGPAGELAALIGVEDLRRARGQGLIQGLQAERRLQGVGQLPAEHVAAEPVDHCHQVHEALAQCAVGHIGAPDLVDAGDRQATQQIRIDGVLGMGLAGSGLGRQPLQAHAPHQPLHTLAIDCMALAAQPGAHAP